MDMRFCIKYMPRVRFTENFRLFNILSIPFHPSLVMKTNHTPQNLRKRSRPQEKMVGPCVTPIPPFLEKRHSRSLILFILPILRILIPYNDLCS